MLRGLSHMGQLDIQGQKVNIHNVLKQSVIFKMASRKGIPNNVGADCKTSIMSVYKALGGAEGMLKWAGKNNDNQTEFYKILAKILPKDIDLSIKELPEARVYPLGLNEQARLSIASETVDSVH